MCIPLFSFEGNKETKKQTSNQTNRKLHLSIQPFKDFPTAEKLLRPVTMI